MVSLNDAADYVTESLVEEVLDDYIGILESLFRAKFNVGRASWQPEEQTLVREKDISNPDTILLKRK